VSVFSLRIVNAGPTARRKRRSNTERERAKDRRYYHAKKAEQQAENKRDGYLAKERHAYHLRMAEEAEEEEVAPWDVVLEEPLDEDERQQEQAEREADRRREEARRQAQEDPLAILRNLAERLGA
jgi:hypothetical protein